MRKKRQHKSIIYNEWGEVIRPKKRSYPKKRKGPKQDIHDIFDDMIDVYYNGR